MRKVGFFFFFFFIAMIEQETQAQLKDFARKSNAAKTTPLTCETRTTARTSATTRRPCRALWFARSARSAEGATREFDSPPFASSQRTCVSEQSEMSNATAKRTTQKQ